MAKRTIFGSLLLSFAACNHEPPLVDGIFTDAEWMKVQTLGPFPMSKPDTTNAYGENAQAAALGQSLFFDKRFSGALSVASELGNVGDKGKVACRTCHDPANGWADSRPESYDAGVSTGAAVNVQHNALGLTNTAYYDWSGWQGFIDNMWAHSMGATENPANSNATRLGVAHHLEAHYLGAYNAIFTPPLDAALDPGAADAARFPPQGKPKASATAPDGAWEMMASGDQAIINRIFVNYGKAMAAFFRQLNSSNAPIDKYVAGDMSAISTSAKQGLKLFIGKAACVQCHSGPLFTDQKFHNDGVPQAGVFTGVEDLGRYTGLQKLFGGPLSPFNSNGAFSDDTMTHKIDGLMPTDADKGRFRTKILREVALTGPYMHTGDLKTLRAVIDQYDRGGSDTGFSGTKDPILVPLNLSEDEKNDLVAFLETLTSPSFPADLSVDTSGQ